MKKQMIKRADGSYSQRGLWDNIRANKGSGKKPTAQMLKQERKIKRNMAEGGDITSAPANTFMSPGAGTDPRFDQYYNQQLQSFTQSGVKEVPSRNDIYSYYQSAKPQSAVDQTGRMMFSNPKGTISSGTTFSQAVDPNTGMVLNQGTNLEKDAFDKQAQRFRSGGINNPGFKALPGYVKAKIQSNMQEGGSMPTTAAGESVLREAFMTMQGGGKMPAGIARARFMASANGNVSKAKETASQYGYKMQKGARIGSNPSTSDNTMAPNPAMMQQRVAEGQALIQKTSTPQGKVQMTAAKQRANANIAATNARKAQQAAQAKAKQLADMKARIADSMKVQSLSVVEQLSPENIARSTQATGDKLRLFGPQSPLVTSGMFEADPNSIFDNYLNPAKFAGDMATNFGQGVQESARTGNMTAVAKALATPIVAGATMGYLKTPFQSMQDQAVNYLTKGVNNASISAAFANPVLTGGIGAGAGLVGRGISRSAKTATTAAEHDIVHRATAPLAVAEYKQGGSIKDMYYMKNGGQFPDRYKKMGFSGVDKPKRTTSGGKSHAVVTKVDGNYKLIRFGQAGVTGDRTNTKRAASFKARHAKNIAKGKSSAAYWANKVKW